MAQFPSDNAPEEKRGITASDKPFHRIGGRRRPPPGGFHVVRQRDEIQVNAASGLPERHAL